MQSFLGEKRRASFGGLADLGDAFDRRAVMSLDSNAEELRIMFTADEE